MGWGVERQWDNGITLCLDLALHWTQAFEALRIKYNVCNIGQLTELNLDGKMSYTLGLIRLWIPRQLTRSVLNL